MDRGLCILLRGGHHFGDISEKHPGRVLEAGAEFWRLGPCSGGLDRVLEAGQSAGQLGSQSGRALAGSRLDVAAGGVPSSPGSGGVRSTPSSTPLYRGCSQGHVTATRPPRDLPLIG